MYNYVFGFGVIAVPTSFVWFFLHHMAPRNVTLDIKQIGHKLESKIIFKDEKFYKKFLELNQNKK